MQFFIFVKRIFSIAIICIILSQQTYSTIRIITPVYNRADFVEWQYKGFKKFLRDNDWELRVFSDANNPQHQKDIEDTCNRLGIMHIPVPQSLHAGAPGSTHPAYRHGRAIQFALEHSGFKHDDIVMAIDSDVFLIREFSIREFLGDYDMMGPATAPNFLFMNPSTLKEPEKMNFLADVINGKFFDPGQQVHDSEGNPNAWVPKHPEVKWKTRGEAHQHLRIDLGLDFSKDIIQQLLSMDWPIEDARLIEAILNVKNDYCNIGFYEKNTFIDYKHGHAWNLGSPDVVAVKATKDRLVIDFLKARLS